MSKGSEIYRTYLGFRFIFQTEDGSVLFTMQSSNMRVFHAPISS